MWTRAQRVAQDDDPQRVNRRARIRWVFEPHEPAEAIGLADALDLHLWPQVGWAWMPPGTQGEVMPPGQHQQHDVAGGLDRAIGTRHDGLGGRNTHALFHTWLSVREARYPAEWSTRLSVVVDTDKIHHAKAGEPWLVVHPRVTRLFLPTDGPRANPLERACGDGHDCCTRHHQRQR